MGNHIKMFNEWRLNESSHNPTTSKVPTQLMNCEDVDAFENESTVTKPSGKAKTRYGGVKLRKHRRKNKKKYGEKVDNEAWDREKVTGLVKNCWHGKAYMIWEAKNGLRDGIERFWDQMTGKLKYETYWKEGNLHGMQKEWNENGKLIHEEEYDNDNPVWEKYYHDKRQSCLGKILP
jgi:antitoxin component YwqK of YwqJK toxin-antitoxin module